MSDRDRPRLLLIGWDAADWKHIDPLLERGGMPHLRSLMDRGSWGNLATLQPVLSPMLWNSIATGKRPDKHGIHGFIEPNPDGRGVRPSTSTTRRCKAIWNILTQAGMTTNVVGWFCSHPAEPINGVCVSDQFAKVSVRGAKVNLTRDDWTLPERSVHPESQREVMEAIRVHPTELTAEDILPFIPSALEIDQKRDARLAVFSKLMSEMVSTHAAATHAMESNDWDFTAVYYDAVDHFSHAFMPYHPPKMDNISPADFERYRHVVSAVYGFHDMMLGRLLELAGPEATVMLCSDHGFHCDHLRPWVTPREPAGPAVWHRDQGILVMAGPGVRRGERIHGASLLDIAPTALLLMGQPIGEDMDGKPQLQALEQSGWVSRIPSWDDVEGDAGMHDPSTQQDPFAANAAVQQLVDLGYIEAPDDDEREAAAKADREARFNLARSHVDAGQLAQADVLFAKLVEEDPDASRYRLGLASCRLAQGRHDEAEAQVNRLLELAERSVLDRADRVETRADRFDGYRQSMDTDPSAPDSENTGGSQADRQSGRQGEADVTADQYEAAAALLREFARALRATDLRIEPRARFMLGEISLARREPERALEYLLAAEQAEPGLPGLHLKIGHAYLRMRRASDAQRAFERALTIDPDLASAHEGLATALSRQGQRERAVDHALSAVELMHHLPRAHLRLGVTLVRLELLDQAITAFQTCLKLAPMSVHAHRWLAALYAHQGEHPDRVQQHAAMAKQAVAWRERQERGSPERNS